MKLNSEKVNLFLAKRLLTKDQLAKKSGVSQKTLWRALTQNVSIRPCTIGKIAMALNCNVEDIS